jgi:hypothetical protein
MPKIVFIEPQAPNLHIFSQFPLPRLGTLILGTMMKKRGWDVEVYVEDFRKIDFDAVASADLVGISTITSTAPRAYAIADRARAAGIPVLMGGPHVTYLTEEALEHADFVVRGEGEAAGPMSRTFPTRTPRETSSTTRWRPGSRTSTASPSPIFPFSAPTPRARSTCRPSPS